MERQYGPKYIVMKPQNIMVKRPTYMLVIGNIIEI